MKVKLKTFHMLKVKRSQQITVKVKYRSENFPHVESEKISADKSDSKIFPSGESESKKLSTC